MPILRSISSATSALARHPLILPLYIPALLLSIAQGLVIPVLPLYVGAFDAPYLWIGLVLAGDGLGHLIGDIPAGMILRRLNQRRGMLLGLALLGLATMALFWARSIPEAFFYRVLAGMGSALYNVSRHTYIAETITVATRGRSVALLGGTFRIGRMIGPIISGSLAVASGLRAPFLAYGLVCALAGLVILLFNRGAAVVPGVPAAQKPPLTLRSMLAMIRSHARMLRAVAPGQFLMQTVRAGPGVVIPLYGAEVLGLDAQQIGWIMSAASGVDMTLFYPTGIIMDRLGRKWAVVPSALIMGLGLALIPLTTGFWGLVAAAVLNGFGNGLGSGVMLTLGADLTPPESRGEFLGMWSLVGDAGYTSGPLLVGAVADVLALQPATLAIASTGFLAGMIFWIFVPETLKKERT